MNYEDIKNKYFNKKFIILYVVIFIILYIFCSFIKFIGQIPILLLLTFLIVYYVNNLGYNFGYHNEEKTDIS
jgi:fatty-acid desaturase